MFWQKSTIIIINQQAPNVFKQCRYILQHTQKINIYRKYDFNDTCVIACFDTRETLNFWCMVNYRNWPRYGLRWSGWYCHKAQHELCRPCRPAQLVLCLMAVPAGTTRAVPYGSTTHSSADRISGQFLFYHDHNFTKSKGNLRFQRFVPLFVPIGVCVTTHDDGTASDVTIGMWRHNQQATNHERNGKPWFSFPK